MLPSTQRGTATYQDLGFDQTKVLRLKGTVNDRGFLLDLVYSPDANKWLANDRIADSAERVEAKFEDYPEPTLDIRVYSPQYDLSACVSVGLPSFWKAPAHPLPTATRWVDLNDPNTRAQDISVEIPLPEMSLVAAARSPLKVYIERFMPVLVGV